MRFSVHVHVAYPNTYCDIAYRDVAVPAEIVSNADHRGQHSLRKEGHDVNLQHNKNSNMYSVGILVNINVEGVDVEVLNHSITR